MKSQVTKMEAPMVSGNPQTQCSMPLRRFIPKMLAMSVGNMRMMLTEVMVFIVWLMLFVDDCSIGVDGRLQDVGVDVGGLRA